MTIVLTQKIITDSDYQDLLYRTYHFPVRYRKQINEGDTFIYYLAGDNKTTRYYFGVGTIGSIRTIDGENYYAELLECRKFENKVFIHLPDNGYIEQLGFQDVRQSLNPPWQWSIRPISNNAYSYILRVAGKLFVPNYICYTPEELDLELKTAIRAYYLGKDQNALFRVENIAHLLEDICSYENKNISILDIEKTNVYAPSESNEQMFARMLHYIEIMHMRYSYNAVLIRALFKRGKNGCISLEKAAKFFREYYNERRIKGLTVETKKCIYLSDDITDKQIMDNIRINPVKALSETEFFYYNEESGIFSLTPEIIPIIDGAHSARVNRKCFDRLKAYFND